MFKRILIANRGEIAVRVIRACRDMGIISVAVYSEADADALHTSLADEAIKIGPPVAGESYLNMRNIIGATKASGAEAIHPGFGFLSENAVFAERCDENGLKFIGPLPETMRRVGDKATAREIAKGAGIPIVPGSEGAVAGLSEALEVAGEIGYPVMIKASSGGGGRGIRLVAGEDEMRKLFDAASREAEAAFGDGGMYVEKYIEAPRHVEIQIMADSFGNVVHLYERDCSVQRRHQKLIEESPSPYIREDTRRRMGEAAVRMAKACGYVNAGTVEFLVDRDRNFYFCEINARIQVEHPVTETLLNVDLVCEQIRVAAGLPLSFRQEELVPRGHVIECRINAEDPDNDFRPCPGEISAIHMPGGIGVRTDSAVYQGYAVPPYYDSMIAKLIVSGSDRTHAITRMKRALAEMLFEGIRTNVDFQMRLIESELFAGGEYGTDFIERLYKEEPGGDR